MLFHFLMCCAAAMSRPVSGKPTSASHSARRLPSRSKTYSGSGSQDLLSYEDIIIAQYLEELRKPPPHTKNGYRYSYSIIVITDCYN